MVSPGEVPDTFTSGESQKEQSPDNGKLTIQQIDDTVKLVEVTPVKPEKPIQDKEGSISSIASAKVLQIAGTVSGAFQSVQSGRSPIIREKVSEDGYHWRKYGQKHVKGNEFIRSYYKCTHPSCLVKKQLERSHDGKISDIVHFGHHDHPKPELHLPQAAAGLVLSVVEEKTDKPLSVVKEGEACSPHKLKSSTTSQISAVTSVEVVKDVLPESNRIDSDNIFPSKRQKKDNRNIEPSHADKLTTTEPRVVVQTKSELDIVNDGYRWRKYGQKMVKGNPNPRSYYRCSSPGCPVKKHVERASDDPKVVITSYEGQHDHNVPLSRTITPNPSGPNICAPNGSKPEATDEATDKNSSPSRKTPKEQPSNSSLIISKTEEDGDICGSGSGAVNDRLDEQNCGEFRAEMKANCGGIESNTNEQCITSAEPIQS